MLYWLYLPTEYVVCTSTLAGLPAHKSGKMSKNVQYEHESRKELREDIYGMVGGAPCGEFPQIVEVLADCVDQY